jgi:hypothetical protein
VPELDDEGVPPELDAVLGAPPLPAAPPAELEGADVAPPDPEEVEAAPPVLLAREPLPVPQPLLARTTDPTTIACP